jgi:site-specific recombinase XerD
MDSQQALTVTSVSTGVAAPVPDANRPFAQNPAAVYLASLSPGSRRTMQTALDTIATFVHPAVTDAFVLPWHQLRYQHTAAIRAYLAERYAAATANKMLSALRGVLRAAWRLGLMTGENYQKACDVGRVTGETLPAGRNVASGELSALMNVCAADSGPAGARDAALLAMLYGCGMRRAELVSLDLLDYDAHEGTMKIKGKRNKQRSVPIVGNVQAALDEWLVVRGNEPGPLLLRIRKGGRLQTAGRLTTQAVYTILETRAKNAGVDSFSPHDLRRTFVGDLLEAGADIATVQQLAGHASVNTTARYDRRGEATRRKAAQMLHVPFFKRS